ncbi:MAG: hypothetical protein ACO321_05115 [Ilumatobacteraceae bacterium]
MGRKRTVREEIDVLERDGTLTHTQATTLRDAPHWSIEANELFAYLGGLIAAIGVTWLTIALVEDTSPVGIAIGMLIAGVVVGVGARLLHRPHSWRARLAEALTVVAVGLIAGSLGIFLNEAGLASEHAATIVTSLCVLLGVAFAKKTQFAATIVFVIATQILVVSLIGTLNLEDSRVAALLFAASGAALIAAGISGIGFPLSARVVGTASYVLGTFTFGVMRDGLGASLGALVLALGLFAVSTRLLQLEVIVGGAIIVTLTTSLVVTRIIDNQAVQGLAIVLIGIGMVVAASALNKRRKIS